MPTETIAVVPYDTTWPKRFEAERSLLEPILAPWLEGGIHHIGSTAVPGLAAKPVVDMMAGVRDLDEAHAAYDVLRTADYHSTPHRPGIAHHFSKPSPHLADSAYGLHLTEPGSDLWLERLAFRDALRDDPVLAAEYARLKRRLAARHPHDGPSYTSGKRDLVVRVLGERGIELGAR